MYTSHPFGGLTMQRLTLSLAAASVILCGFVLSVFAQLTPEQTQQAQVRRPRGE